MKLLIATLAMLLVSPAALASADRGAAQPAFELAQDEGRPADPPKDIDINVQIGEEQPAAPAVVWYAEPIWIAVFIVGGVALLALLVVASRGSGSPATIVKG